MFSLLSIKFLAMRNITLYSVDCRSFKSNLWISTHLCTEKLIFSWVEVVQEKLLEEEEVEEEVEQAHHMMLEMMEA